MISSRDGKGNCSPSLCAGVRSEPDQQQDESPFLTVWIVLLIVFQLLINRGQINVKTE